MTQRPSTPLEASLAQGPRTGLVPSPPRSVPASLPYPGATMGRDPCVGESSSEVPARVPVSRPGCAMAHLVHGHPPTASLALATPTCPVEWDSGEVATS